MVKTVPEYYVLFSVEKTLLYSVIKEDCDEYMYCKIINSAKKMGPFVYCAFCESLMTGILPCTF